MKPFKAQPAPSHKWASMIGLLSLLSLASLSGCGGCGGKSSAARNIVPPQEQPVGTDTGVQTQTETQTQTATQESGGISDQEKKRRHW